MIHWHYDHTLSLERLKQLIFDERGYFCEYCGLEYWSQLHHCLLHRSKRYPQLNAAVNLQAVCPRCHMNGGVNSRENKQKFRELQIGRGYDPDRWISELPLKIHGH